MLTNNGRKQIVFIGSTLCVGKVFFFGYFFINTNSVILPKIECGVDSYTVRVSKNTYTCTSGATVAVQNALSYNIAFDGTIRCPDYDIVCAGQAVSWSLFSGLYFLVSPAQYTENTVS